MLCLLFFIIWTAKAFVIHIENEYAPMYSPSFYSEKGGLYYLPDVIRASEKDEIRLDYVIPIGGTYSGMITFDIVNESDKLTFFWSISNPEDGDSKTIFSASMDEAKASQHEFNLLKDIYTDEIERWQYVRFDYMLTWYLLDSQAFVKIQKRFAPSSGMYYIRSAMNHLYLRAWKGKLIYDTYAPQSDISFRFQLDPQVDDSSFFIEVNDPKYLTGTAWLAQNSNNTLIPSKNAALALRWNIFLTEHNWFAIKVKDLFIDALNCVGRTGRYAEPCFPGSEVLPVSSDEITPSSISFEFISAGSDQSRLDPRVR